jgi:ABC-2 type transport system ATP-binding protein
MLDIRQLGKSYGQRRVLDGVDLTAAPGQIVGLLGANGAGKTTLISIVTGLRRADGGSVSVGGVDALRHPRRAARLIGLAPQELGLYPTLTTGENLEFFARLAGLRGAEAHGRAVEVAERLGLTDQLKQKGAELSGGQKRRLHTGMAVLHRPALLFLDEPTVGADVQSRAGILDLVRELAADGAAVVYTTHYLTELEQLGADIAVLHAGRVAVRAPLAQILARYATASVALHFAGPPPVLPGWQVLDDSLVPVVPVDDPAGAAARALAELGSRAATLTEVALTPASLESAYLAITGAPIAPIALEDTDALVA